MRIILDTTKGRIIVPKSFFTELGKMNKILEEGGSTKKWTPEEYVKEQFEKAIKKISCVPTIRSKSNGGERNVCHAAGERKDMAALSRWPQLQKGRGEIKTKP